MKNQPHHTPPFNIILADDDEDDRFFFKEAVDELQLHATVIIVNDGAQLLFYLNQKEIVLPKLIFLDINMPGTSGIKILSEIRAQPQFKDITIAMYSTSLSPTDIKKALEGGADIYIKKPSDFELLKKLLQKAILGNWRGPKELNKSIENFIMTDY